MRILHTFKQIFFLVLIGMTLCISCKKEKDEADDDIYKNSEIEATLKQIDLLDGKFLKIISITSMPPEDIDGSGNLVTQIYPNGNHLSYIKDDILQVFHTGSPNSDSVMVKWNYGNLRSNDRRSEDQIFFYEGPLWCGGEIGLVGFLDRTSIPPAHIISVDLKKKEAVFEVCEQGPKYENTYTVRFQILN